jgi:hypothetical protein
MKKEATVSADRVIKRTRSPPEERLVSGRVGGSRLCHVRINLIVCREFDTPNPHKPVITSFSRKIIKLPIAYMRIYGV